MKRDILTKILEVFCVFLFAILVLCVVAQVTTRYALPFISLPWTEEIARILYIWVVFFGMILVESKEKGIRTTYFLSKMIPPVRIALITCINGLSIIFSVVLCYGSWLMLFESWPMMIGSIKWITAAVIYMPTCISPIFICFYLARGIVKAFKNGGAVPEEGADS